MDDDDSIRRSLARLFRINGIIARAFASAEEYLSRDSSDQPGCLVVDVNLVGLSGLELRDRLDAAGTTPHIIFISAWDDEAPLELETGGSAGHDYLSKPFDTKALLGLVRRHVSDPGTASRREVRDQCPAA